MFNANNVNAKLTLAETEHDEEQTTYRFTCNETVTLGGEGLWGYTAEGDAVTVTGINVHERSAGDEVYCDVYAELAEERIVYTDDSFVQAVSALLDMEVDYTEQGMQDYGLVSMET